MSPIKDYVSSDGKAEIVALLSEFGKFPAFTKNWKPSDFNFTKALTTGSAFNFTLNRDSNHIYSIYLNLNPFYSQGIECIRDLLHFDFHLTEDPIVDVINGNRELFIPSSHDYHSNVSSQLEY